MPSNKLTDRVCRSAKPQEKLYKLSDGKSLSLLVFPTGKKTWRQKFRLAGKERTYTIGDFPDVSLSAARDKSSEVRGMVKAGLDPVAERKALTSSGAGENVRTFEQLILQWHADQTTEQSEKHRDQVLATLRAHMFPDLGKLPDGQVRPVVAKETLKKIEAAGLIETAHRCRMWASKAYRWAIASGELDTDPFATLAGALRPRNTKNHFSKVEADEMPKLLKEIDKYAGEPLTKHALLFTILTMVRTNETRFAEWSDIDIDARVWSIPAEKMKMKREHMVPLSDQVVQLLREVYQHSGRYRWVFPQVRNHEKPMSENTMLYALYKMGWHQRATVHGFRALASTVLHESGEFESDVIERQLAHVEGNAVKAAYNRAQYISERARLTQWWADWVFGR